MSPVVERLLTVAITAAVTGGLAQLGFTGVVHDAKASRQAQDQCCPLAHECLEGLLQ